MINLLLCLFLGGGAARAGALDGDWSRTDTLWEAGFAAAVVLDWSQSRQIEALGRYERNPLLPRHPSERTMTAICAGSILGHAAVSWLLPPPWRRRFQGATLLLEVAAVGDNHFRAGLRFKF